LSGRRTEMNERPLQSPLIEMPEAALQDGARSRR
jgi:hypothetical protein